MPTSVSIIDPLEGKGLQVVIQDQHSEIIVSPLHTVINSGTLLASNTVLDGSTISLSPGHGASAGNIICIKENSNYYSAGILSFTDDIATIDSPLDRVFTTSADVCVGNTNLKLVGSLGSPLTAQIGPPPSGVEWDIVRLHVSITDNVVMDSAKFGGIAGLTNGVVLRAVNGNTKNIANIKTNGDLSLLSNNYYYDDKAPAGVYTFASKHIFGGQSEVGVTIRLVGSDSDTLQVVIQDDLSDLVSLKIVVIGHVVVS